MRQLITLLILFISAELFGLDYSIDTIIIQSDLVSENRAILIYKPDNCRITDSVSIIYLLDGESSDCRFKRLQEEMPDNQLIGIGIVNTNRNRDMLPIHQPDNFLSFIQNELIPKVEDDYLVRKRILYGHSFAGGFTVYAMLKAPGLFKKYIASSPTPIMDFIEPEIYEHLNKKLNTIIQLYFSYGTKDIKQVRKWNAKLNLSLTGLSLNRIDWMNRIFEGENHNTSDLVALLNGMKN